MTETENTTNMKGVQKKMPTKLCTAGIAFPQQANELGKEKVKYLTSTVDGSFVLLSLTLNVVKMLFRTTI